jgi:hypothetical protein
MIKQKVTPWFPGTVKPARRGVYERDWLDGGPNWFSYWNGKKWGSGDNDAEGAAQHENTDVISDHQKLPWRGLAQPPKAKP